MRYALAIVVVLYHGAALVILVATVGLAIESWSVTEHHWQVPRDDHLAEALFASLVGILLLWWLSLLIMARLWRRNTVAPVGICTLAVRYLRLCLPLYGAVFFFSRVFQEL
jgi:hypothetical protein